MRNVERFKEEVRAAINRSSIDNELNVPDWILADYVVSNLEALQRLNQLNVKWHVGPTEPAPAPEGHT
jgi:hypothetical protein